MNSKPFYMSKAVIGGILVCAGAVGLAISKEGVDTEVITLFGNGLGLLGIRFALD